MLQKCLIKRLKSSHPLTKNSTIISRIIIIEPVGALFQLSVQKTSRTNVLCVSSYEPGGAQSGSLVNQAFLTEVICPKFHAVFFLLLNSIDVHWCASWGFSHLSPTCCTMKVWERSQQNLDGYCVGRIGFLLSSAQQPFSLPMVDIPHSKTTGGAF